MLDNEPIVGAAGLDGDATAQETKPVRRRRAASRPAGPPPEDLEVTAGPPAPTVVPPAPAGPSETGDETAHEPPAQVAPDGVQQAAPEAPPAEAPRATRSRRATARDGEPAPARRRATRKAAPPPEEPAATAEPAAPAPPVTPAESGTPAEPAAPAQPVAEPAAVEAPAAPVRRRRTRKTAEPAESAGSAESARPAEPAPPAEQAQPAATAPAGAGGATPDVTERSTPAGEDAAVAVPVEETIAAALAEEALDDEPAGEEIIEEGAPQGSLFADPFGVGARARAAAAPPVSFQAPAAVFQPIFQAPEPRVFVPPAAPETPARRPAGPVDEPVATDAADGTDAGEAEETAEPLGYDEDDETEGGRRRRRRRGGRGRGKARELDESGDAEEPGEFGESEDTGEAAGDDDREGSGREEEAEESGSSRRRRRRRRRSGDADETPADEPPNTVTRIRAPRAGRTTSVDQVQGFRGSTRLEAKKQRRREGREQGRRRPPVITESEFLARRESVERVMVVRRQAGRTQIAVMEDGVLVEHYVDREAGQSYVGNVYLGKVQNVLPSMEAAFIDIGKGRNAVLYAGEVNFDTAGLEGQPKRIEVALKSGQSVLVQVTKDPMGHKGARLTSQISLPGRYLVYVPDGSMTGISRKLPDKERSRLKSILKKVMPENAGVIVRTAAEGASEEELSRDVARLAAQWENIQRKAKSAGPPELLYSEPDLTIRVVRDVFNEDFASLVVAGDEVWGTVDEYVRYVAPHLVDRLTRWEEGDVFAAYRIDEQIAKAMERKVWLPSGGSLVIDRTEAMTVVDVNTGKFTGQGGNLEETVTRNNLEAAEEIVRQLRLRDIGGIIVVDFIDMVLESNRDLVLRRMLECLARDRTKHQVAEVTSLGLVQMTRKRVGQGLLEAFSTPCDCCNGRGLIVSAEPVEGRPEPRGTQGKMAVEKAVAEKLEKSGRPAKEAAPAVAANGEAARDSVTGAVAGGGEEAEQPAGRARRRSRKATRPAGPVE
ncbi:hypothetical protein Sru01_60600 [Sphaerisporangium rufum]|uniref:Ribonuclease E n=1 Tax=Sphaerisporangium rufum TaxID=1381558 RepID=A0A919R8A8_9ACTN|nr:Rne/Rng family ribonuclease [Sphaerisporangium rufum]GII81078.1 hypothetical protein Sru01_60600 [Sphaerisporangium rufum]